MSETPPAAATPIDYRVEIENGALRLRLEIATKSIPVPISGEQAALLGRALLAASVRLAVAPDGEGTVEPCDLPVAAWRTGLVRDHRLVVLMLDLPGGGSARFQLHPAMATGCGQALHDSGIVFDADLP
ncbi:hypothetical protein [Methylobacterium indicum]|uniref:Uncharacterized protein n=1 Tax=Methylobacterium indicum TaxID=1775910 RepID=A0A0J6QUS6_9HYPH|nr:hypothetical protein [Methylobacterium indicum]KMO09972.1 hypothetical protein QR79_31625 [Methylobacterium indicum]KMO14620.1 hypothetical protein QR78_23030 [Methylobacterium indicum]BCM83634.1 hypothetical protein mvi_20950 [Methylobacterium indicum]